MAWTEIHLFGAAAFCLLASLGLRLARPGCRLPERAMAWGALLFLASGLGYAALQANHLPLPSTTDAKLVAGGQWMVITGAATLLWFLLNDRGSREGPRQEQSPFPAYGIIVILLLCGIMRWTAGSTLSGVSGPVARSTMVGMVPRVLWWMSSVMLLLASGALVCAGSMALGRLADQRLGQEHALVTGPEGETSAWQAATADVAPVALGAFPLLTASLLLSVMARLYTQGVYWNWAAVDSWRLVGWLFAASLWYGCVLLGWTGRRLQLLAVIGLGLVLVMLVAISG